MATPDPTATLSLKIVTVLPLSAVPVNVSVVTLVALSVLDRPESDALIRSGTEGASGAVVSMVTNKLDEVPLVLPALTLCAPFDSADVVMV
jgi:hypothetical protein